MNFTTHQAVGPPRVHQQLVAQQLHTSLGIAATQIDQSAVDRLPGVEAEMCWKGSTHRGSFEPLGIALSASFDVVPRVSDEGGQVVKLEALPDFGLPKAVEARCCSESQARVGVQTQD